jgi:hypothetical protein
VFARKIIYFFDSPLTTRTNMAQLTKEQVEVYKKALACLKNGAKSRINDEVVTAIGYLFKSQSEEVIFVDSMMSTLIKEKYESGDKQALGSLLKKSGLAQYRQNKDKEAIVVVLFKDDHWSLLCHFKYKCPEEVFSYDSMNTFHFKEANLYTNILVKSGVLGSGLEYIVCPPLYPQQLGNWECGFYAIATYKHLISKNKSSEGGDKERTPLSTKDINSREGLYTERGCEEMRTSLISTLTEELLSSQKK